MQNWFLKQWQTFGLAQIVLLPLSWLFGALSAFRRWLYATKLLVSYQLPVPVIIVGNISVGGTGKTPLVIYLADQLKKMGYTPGIISRGYGGTQSGEVTLESNPLDFGDEPVLIAKRTGFPVWVNVNRVEAGQALLKQYPQCNVIISDDGLQHYRLKRDIELIVVNSKHSLGNQHLLPSGPLREKVSRFSTVDAIVDTGRVGLKTKIQQPLPPIFSMQLHMLGIFSLDEQSKMSLEMLKSQRVVAIAGIGHPERFFNFVKGLGLQCEYRAFKDHHVFTQQDFADMQDKTILMTEKDAVKCKQLALNNAWYMPVSAMLAQSEEQKMLVSLIVEQLQKH
ncbi:MAG: tetraacyldisaccharide 4'-kinase [Methylophilus sp.]|nr:tetraacyldisaccharide 4'-kinase [Methylophilus sp.]